MPGSRSSSAWPKPSDGAVDEDALRAALSAERARGALAGRLRRDEEPVVLLLQRERPLPPPSLLDRRHDGCRSPPSARTFVGSRQARTSPARAAVLAERERITGEHRSLLTARCAEPSTRASRSHGPSTRSSRTTTSTSSTGSSRSSGTQSRIRRTAREGAFLTDAEDVFYLRHEEVREALEELRIYWGSGGAGVLAARATGHRSSHGARRSTRRCVSGRPLLLSAEFPDDVRPGPLMLWGFTDERIRDWVSAADGADSAG